MIYFISLIDKDTKHNIINYIQNFNKTDVSVRDFTNYSEYIINTISKKVKHIISEDVKIIDSKLRAYDILYKMHWKIAILQDNVEQNFPHTHNDVIFLPSSYIQSNVSNRIDTLLHEKLHIFQRKYPIQTQILFTKYWNIIPYSLRSFEVPKRSNPDINHIVYAFFSPVKNEYIYNISEYNENALRINDAQTKEYSASNLPFNIDDDRLANMEELYIYYDLMHNNAIRQTEHPNETMACLITDIVLNNNYHGPTIKWMKEHL